MVDKGVYSPDSRKGNAQNPYKQPRMTFRKEIATRISNRQKKIDIKHPSEKTQREIFKIWGRNYKCSRKQIFNNVYCK